VSRIRDCALFVISFFQKISQDVRARAHLLVVRKMRRKKKKKETATGLAQHGAPAGGATFAPALKRGIGAPPRGGKHEPSSPSIVLVWASDRACYSGLPRNQLPIL
jgi:hypothetical protein